MKVLKNIFLIVVWTSILLGSKVNVFSQGSFALPEGDKRDKVSFDLINNLVIIPVEVNGTPLSFLLDTGVKSTIIFSLAKQDSVELKETKPVNIRGLGDGGFLRGLKSENNEIKIGNAISKNHTIYVIFENSLNLSPRMGVPINGIIGLDFFESFIVKTSYTSKKIKFYKPSQYSYKKCRRCEVLDLKFYKDKPYVDVVVKSENQNKEVTLLLDSGSSDAVWLFKPEGYLKENPKNYFEDFLGLGLSGHIYGKRSRLQSVRAETFELESVNVAFPNKEATENLELYIERDGSLGGDFLKRFTVTMDYPNKKVMLKPNRYFSDPFHYNMSGLTIEHDGVDVYTEKQSLEERTATVGSRFSELKSSTGYKAFNIYSKTEIFLVPRYVVAEIRKNSVAEKSGILKGDEITKYNGRPIHKYKLQELNTLFSSEEGKRINLEILRNNRKFKVSFRLEKVL